MKKLIAVLVTMLVIFGGVAAYFKITSVDLYAEATKVAGSDIVQTDSEYFLYFYSESCSACVATKPTMNKFYGITDTPIYLVDMARETAAITSDEIDGFTEVTATPTLVQIKDGREVARYKGSVEVKDFVNAQS